MTKRIISFLLMNAVVLSLSACGVSRAEEKGRTAFREGPEYDYHCGALFGRTVSADEIPSGTWERTWDHKRGSSGNRDTACVLLRLAESVEYISDDTGSV